MASVPYLLMNEFHSEAQSAGDNYDRKFVFDDAEGMVNNFIHGRSADECFSLTRKVIAGWAKDESRNNAEHEAIADALVVIDIFAEQYGLTLEG